MSSTSDAILHWLEKAGAKKIRVSSDNAVSCCPFHRDSTPSFAMHVETGVYVCYSASCGASGSFVRFLHDAFNMSWLQAIQEAENVLGATSIDSPLELPSYDDRRRKTDAPKEVKNQSTWLMAYDICPTYMLERGFEKKILKAWSIGFDKANRRVTIPIMDSSGRLLGFTKRSTTLDDVQAKYLHVAVGNDKEGFDVKSVLFGEHMFSTKEAAIVTEGHLDAMAAHQLRGGANDVACLSTMGSKVTDAQLNALAKYKTLYLVPDADSAGKYWTSKILEFLVPTLLDRKVFVGTVVGFKDAAELMQRGGTLGDIRYVTAEEFLIGGKRERRKLPAKGPVVMPEVWYTKRVSSHTH
jgi:DNA primase